MIFDPATNTVHAAGRTWHADPTRTQLTDAVYGPDNEYSHRTRRCIIRFETGWSASIIWGDYTYSSNYDAWRGRPFTEEPDTVEVGVLDHTGELRQRAMSDDGTDWHSVESYVDDDALAALLDRLATLPTDYDYGYGIPPPTIDEIRNDYNQLRTAIAANGGVPLAAWPEPEPDR